MAAPDLPRAAWRKSARSGGTGGNCVEVASNLPGLVMIRDSKDPHGPKLVFTPAEWETFTTGVRGGEFHLA
jgi:Domain of unknown function (DUF397)